jgi:hypothetical protein
MFAMACDILYRDGRDFTARPLRDRRARLEDVVAGSELVFPVRRLAPDSLDAWGRGPRTWLRGPGREGLGERLRAGRTPRPEDRAGQILVLHETGENVIYTPARAADAAVASEALPHHERLRPAPHVGFGRAESRGQAREAVGVWQLTLDCGCDPLDQVDHVDVQLRGACAL